jgi:hypothetical protein
MVLIYFGVAILSPTMIRIDQATVILYLDTVDLYISRLHTDHFLTRHNLGFVYRPATCALWVLYPVRWLMVKPDRGCATSDDAIWGLPNLNDSMPI